MESSRNIDATGETADDLSALAWVHDELRRSLDAAHKALRRFVKEAEALNGSDVDVVDPAVLRTARAQIHQGVGALELVGLPSAAALLRACEAAVQNAYRTSISVSRCTNMRANTAVNASWRSASRSTQTAFTSITPAPSRRPTCRRSSVVPARPAHSRSA